MSYQLSIPATRLSDEVRERVVPDGVAVLFVRDIEPSDLPGTYRFWFADKEGQNIGCLYEFELPEDWVEFALKWTPPC